MKKKLFIALAATILIFVGCDDPETPGIDGNASVVGTWTYRLEDGSDTLRLNADGTFYHRPNGWQKSEGTYAYTQDSLVLNITKAWEKNNVLDSATQASTIVWQEVEPYIVRVASPARFLYNGEVLMLDDQVANAKANLQRWAPYVNVNAIGVSNLLDIQGKWWWVTDWNGSPRAIVNVDVDTADIIIVPWGERYRGAISYDKGVIRMDYPTYYTTRYDDGEGGWDHMNEDDPESSDWRIPVEDGTEYWYPAWTSLRLGFVVDGSLAYGSIASLPAVFQKR